MKRYLDYLNTGTKIAVAVAGALSVIGVLPLSDETNAALLALYAALSGGDRLTRPTNGS